MTVIIPVLNGADVLPLTTDAVLAQPVDLIIYVDDGSTDSTATQLSSLSLRDARVQVVRLGTNQGRAAARNAGVGHAEASGARGLFLFLDADVAPAEGYADAMSRAMESPGAVAAVGSLRFPDVDAGDPYHTYLASSRRGIQTPVSGSHVSWRYFLGGVAAVTTDALNRAGGFPEAIRYGEDLALACSLSQFAPHGLRHAPEALADLYDLGTLASARQKLAGFASDLGQIVADCPEALQIAGFDALLPAGPLGRLAMAAARWRAPASVCASFVTYLPSRLQPLAVRYLLGHTFVTNARLDAHARSSQHS